MTPSRTYPQPRLSLVVDDLKQENNELRANFDELKELHLDLLENHEGLKRRHESLSEEQERSIQQHRSLCDEFQEELQAKVASFEAAKEALSKPRNVELLRAQVHAEIEEIYTDRCNCLSQEVVDTTHDLHLLQRQHENLKGDHAALIRRHALQSTERQSQHNAAIKSLEDRLKTLEPAGRDMQKQGQEMQRLQIHSDDQAAILKSLESELHDLRTAKEDAVVAMEAATGSCQAKINGFKLEAMEWEGRAISAEERVKTLDVSVDEAMRDNETLHDQLAMLQSMHASLQAHLDHSTHRHEAERQSAAEAAAEAQADHQEQLSALTLKAAEVESRLTQLKQQHSHEMLSQHQEMDEAAAAAQSRAEAAVEAQANLQRQLAAVTGQLRLLQSSQGFQQCMSPVRAKRETSSASSQDSEAEELPSRHLTDRLAQAEAAAAQHEAERRKLLQQLHHSQERQQEAERGWAEQKQVASQLQDALEAEASEHAEWVEHAAGAWALERAAQSKRLQTLNQDSQDQQAALVHKARHKLREARREITRLTQLCSNQQHETPVQINLQDGVQT
ncbi:hypothetical protein WJX74_000501 [Apatococcus lobatus]|uniref:Uncharacterized protein n=1 Tax=Apatococcus lobatus TaxID=904363 RepID=A0AAW1QLI0_9CHLO